METAATLRVTGASRSDDEKAITLYLNRAPTDDELRMMHESARLAAHSIAGSPLLNRGARGDLRLDGAPDHPLTAGLRQMVHDNNLRLAVLLTMNDERAGVNSCATNGNLATVANRLADRILAKLTDGEFDAALEGR